MDDTAKDLMILVVMAELGGDGLTAGQIAARTVIYEAPVSVRDVSSRLMHLKARRPGYVIQDPRKAQVWHITPDGMKWAAQNRRK